jgi:hypothetical protein
MSDSSGGDGTGNTEGHAQQPIPRGIEVLVKKASIDPAFRQALLEKRASAAAEIGLELSAGEAAMLNSVPQSQIEQIIENTTVPDEHRRVFLGKAAGAMLAVIGLGLGLSSCATGIRPDRLTPEGSRPDLPTKESEGTEVDSRTSATERHRSAGSEGRNNKDSVSDKESSK